MNRLSTLALVALLFAPRLAGQGTLSSQAFGYPPGQFSSRARGTGGGLAEFDPATPLNPAALASWGRSGLLFEYAPEFRRVTVEDSSESATVARFPLTGAMITVGERAVLGLTVSTFLDRTWQTQERGQKTFMDRTVDFTTAFRSTGAINDVRLGGSWVLSRALRVGLGGHLITGSNRLDVATTFTDTSAATNAFVQRTTVSYSGTAASAGVDWRPIPSVAVALSGRVGGTLRAFENDTARSSASVPSRVGAGVEYIGFSGTSIAASASWNGWSGLDGLGSDRVTTFDGWDVGIGAEVRGPRWFGSAVPLRGGIRRRTLPFGVGPNEVRESAIGFGAGFVLARGRANTDVTLQRARRSSAGNIAERAWTFNVGITVRP